jgi:low affinity Fe/Cu permease
MSNWFAQFSNVTGRIMGQPLTLIVNCLIIVLWAGSGPLFGFSDTWQLVVNTGTTVFTYLLLFVIQNTQNRDSAALHVKLDEILRALPDARTRLATVALEDAPEAVIALEHERTQELAQSEPAPG